jgi:hypothetical protein
MKETEVLRAATEYTFDGTHQALRPFRGNFRTCAQLTPVIRQGLNVGDLVVGVGLVELFKPLAAQCRICGALAMIGTSASMARFAAVS